MEINRLGDNIWRERTTIGGYEAPSSDNSEILIFLDTNFLLAISQMSNFNLSHELDRVFPQKRKLIVLEPVFAELKKLSNKGRPKVQMESRCAIEFTEKYCELYSSEYSHKNIDFILLHHSKKAKGVIGTNDRKLRKIARGEQIKTLYIRNKRFLEIR